MQAVKHRWLDESAPMKLSPLREALEAGKTLLGDEMPSLDLEAAPQPELPAIIPPPPDAAAAATGHETALAEREAVPDEDTARLDMQPEQADAPAGDSIHPAQGNASTVTALREATPDLAASPALAAEVPSPLAAMEPADATPEVAVAAANSLRRGSVRGRSRGRGRGARGRSAGRGKKRKVHPTASSVEASMPWPAVHPMHSIHVCHLTQSNVTVCGMVTDD